MRAGRLVSILLLLQLRVRLTAEELAGECEVSVRTIYRDIDELGRAGVPIYADRGPGGGFQLVDGYRTRLTGLGNEEAEAVFVIGMPTAAEALGLGSAAARAGRKVLASLPPALSEGAGRLGARFHLDPVDWYREAEVPAFLPSLARAVLDQQVVSMTYESWTARRELRIEPLGLVLKAATWYVVGQRDGIARIYRISSIQAMTVEEATFERPADFDLPAFWAAELARFELTLRPDTATVRASAAGRKRIASFGAYASRAVAGADQPDADGWAEVSLPIENVDHAALLLLGAGPEVEVLTPPSLREHLRALATAIAERQR